MKFGEYVQKYDELHIMKETLLCVMIDLIRAGKYDAKETIERGEYARVWKEIQKLNDEYFGGAA